MQCTLDFYLGSLTSDSVLCARFPSLFSGARSAQSFQALVVGHLSPGSRRSDAGNGVQVRVMLFIRVAPAPCRACGGVDSCQEEAGATGFTFAVGPVAVRGTIRATRVGIGWLGWEKVGAVCAVRDRNAVGAATPVDLPEVALVHVLRPLPIAMHRKGRLPAVRVVAGEIAITEAPRSDALPGDASPGTRLS